MRVLVIDPGHTHIGTETKASGPLSVSVSETCGPELPRDYDLIVLPVDLFLDRAGNPGPGVPRIAYGPVYLMADAFAEGCVDYLREPWDVEELEARALRFRTWKFRLGESSYSYSAGRLAGAAGSKRLSEGERKTLELLLLRLGRTVPRQAFLHGQGSCDRPESRSLDMSICRLRMVLAGTSGNPQAGSFLAAVRNYGYRLDGEPCA